MATAPARYQGGATPAQKHEFVELLDLAKDEIRKLIPAHVSVDRVVRVARSAYLGDPKLQNCNPASLLRAVMSACELGLEPGGARRQCHLVPFKGEVSLILGYAGCLELARRSGQYKSIETRCVYEGDEFALEYTPEPVFTHRPTFHNAGPEKLVYAYARLTSGEMAFEVMTRAEVEGIRNRLPEFQRQSPAWKNFWAEMARKVVLKRLLKRLPNSIELADALDHDNTIETTAEPVEAAPVQRKIDRSEELADRLALPVEIPVEPEPVEGAYVPTVDVNEDADPDMP